MQTIIGYILIGLVLPIVLIGGIVTSDMKRSFREGFLDMLPISIALLISGFYLISN